MLNARELIGSHDALFVTLDTLRFDVAEQTLREGRTPHFAKLLPGRVWERRHSPATFTFAAHQAFFAGFLPTPPRRGKSGRLFAARFPGSETTCQQTCVFDAPNIVEGMAGRGYHTVCIGGVGFFNKQSPLGAVLPALFQESHWKPAFAVNNRSSTEHQVDCALRILSSLPAAKRLFLFLNVSALHQPNRFYLEGATEDSAQSQAAALAYVDGALAPLWEAARRRGPALCVVCSDHGTAYGEDGYWGHRLAHPVVWDVPYAEFVLC